MSPPRSQIFPHTGQRWNSGGCPLTPAVPSWLLRARVLLGVPSPRCRCFPSLAVGHLLTPRNREGPSGSGPTLLFLTLSRAWPVSASTAPIPRSSPLPWVLGAQLTASCLPTAPIKRREKSHQTPPPPPSTSKGPPPTRCSGSAPLIFPLHSPSATGTHQGASGGRANQPSGFSGPARRPGVSSDSAGSVPLRGDL